MATTKETLQTALADTTVNCCNGRVGKRMLELAEKSEFLRKAIAPTGVEFVRQAAAAGRSLGETVNCCNGRVGRSLDLNEVVSQLGNAG
jgi:hypothetical protein